MSNLRYLLLMRHGKHGPEEKNGKREGEPHVLNATGMVQTQEVADTLKAHLEEAREGIVPGLILHATSGEATQTAERVRDLLKAPRRKQIKSDELTKKWDIRWQNLKVESMEVLDPVIAFRSEAYKKNDGDPPNPGRLAEHLRQEVEKQSSALPEGSNAVLIVGHQPLLGWIAYTFVGESPPLERSEIVCYEIPEHEAKHGTNPDATSEKNVRIRSRKPVWAISPSDEKTLEDLREKIKKKMELAGTLGGFITAGIGFLIGTFAEGKADSLKSAVWMLFLALGCLFLAVICYLCTMFSYDSLLMPRRFWSETPSGQTHRPRWVVARPPSSAHWVLYQNMIHIWQWQFIPATALGLYGLFVLGVAVTLAAVVKSHEIVLSLSCLVIAVTPPGVAAAMVCARLAGQKIKTRTTWQTPRDSSGLNTRLRYLFGPWIGSED